MNVSCKIILDLIPLVKDGVASEESTKLVKEHIQNCESCMEEFESIKLDNIKNEVLNDEKIILSIKKSIYVTELVILIAGTAIGIGLTNSMGMFYNILIMPIIGALGYAFLNKKWFIVPISILVLSSLWQGIQNYTEGVSIWQSLPGLLSLGFIYAFLTILGVLITILLKFAFKNVKINS